MKSRIKSRIGLKDFFAHRVRNSALLFGVVPVGTAFGRWISKIISLPQLRKRQELSITDD